MVTREACFVTTLHCNLVLKRHKNKSAEPIATVPKKDIFLALPFLGSQSEVLARRVKSCVSKFYGYVNLRVILNNTCRGKSFFPYKDRFSRSQRSKVVYKASCWDCDSFYVGKTKEGPSGGLCSRVPFKILTLFLCSRPKFHLVPLLPFQDKILSLILCIYVVINQTKQNKITYWRSTVLQINFDHYFCDIFYFVKVFRNKN